MRIRVTREFGGRMTHEQRIYPGEYDLDDPALFGVGQYLVDNSFAEALETIVEAEPVDAAVDTTETVSDTAGEVVEAEPPPASKSRRARR